MWLKENFLINLCNLIYFLNYINLVILQKRFIYYEIYDIFYESTLSLLK